VNNTDEVPRAIILMGDDPRTVNDARVGIDPVLARIRIVAYVVPYKRMSPNHHRYFREIPIISWEDPNTDREKAEQYLKLFQLTEAEEVIHLGWPHLFVCGFSDFAYVNWIQPPLFEGLNGRTLSYLVHHYIYGHMPGLLSH
jgi:hypothetical protein